MAGVSKTKSDVLPYGNLTKDPTALPQYVSYSAYSPNLINGAGQTTNAGGTTFWNAWEYYGGDYGSSETMASYVTIVHVTNLTSPIVIGCFIGRYANQSTSDHKMRITVDGRQYIIEMENFEGRMILGSTFLDVSTTSNQLNGRSGSVGYPALNNTHFGQLRWDTVEQPMHQYQDGQLMLYAESELKFEDYLSASTNTNVPMKYAGVQYQHLGNNV